MKYLFKILIPFILLLTAFFGGIFAERYLLLGANISLSSMSFTESIDSFDKSNPRKNKHEMRLQRQHKRLRRKLVKRLSLTDEQQEKLDSLLRAKKNDLRALREEMHPKMKAHRDDFKEKVNSILSDEQQQKFKQIKLERRPRGRSGGKRRRGKHSNQGQP